MSDEKSPAKAPRVPEKNALADRARSGIPKNAPARASRSEIRKPGRRIKRESLFHAVVHRQLPLESETTAFILVNVVDFLMTYLMLATGHFRESNPVARWFLESWGPIKGMLYFKLTMVTVVCLIAQIVYPRRPTTARLLLIAGSLAVCAVVVSSLAMFLRHGGHLPVPAPLED